jgi:hypothetical protein
VYGLDVSVPINVEPLKKATFATVPSESAAVAASAMFAGAVNDAPVVGDVSDTVGSAGVGETVPLPVTVKLVDAELTAPLSSYARATMVCAPAGTPDHRTENGAYSSVAMSVDPS